MQVWIRHERVFRFPATQVLEHTEVLPMAGRPRTMARRVNDISFRLNALSAELESLMPEQYQKPSKDELGGAWRAAMNAVANADDLLDDLAAHLEVRAQRADQRRTTTSESSTG